MALRKLIAEWPVVRQFRDGDPLGLGKAAQSERSKALRARIADADSVVPSICPFCAVGCGQTVYVKDGEVTYIDGDPASPVSRGRLCPKGHAAKNYAEGPLREYKVKYRPPRGTAWQSLDLDTAMEMIVDRVLAAREQGWEWENDEGHRVRRTLGLANLGGATLDNEENYLIKKLMTALGVVMVENQARI
jgi:formate dehydrogenase major subunit